MSICLDINALTLRLFDKAAQLGNNIHGLYSTQQSHFPLVIVTMAIFNKRLV